MKNVLKAGEKFLLKLVLKRFQISNDDWEDLKSLLNEVSTSELN